MKHLKTVALLLLPPLAMGGFAFYLGRTNRDKPAIVDNGPFAIKVAGVERRPIEAVDVHDGYNHKFDVIFGARGRKPAWWGTRISSWSGTRDSTWKFFLERDGVTTPFPIPMAMMQTSSWDDERKRYFNRVLLNIEEVPTESDLKVRGVTQLSDNPTKLSPPLPFELTLKKAGEKWAKPVVSTDPGLVIRSIEVKPFGATHRKATIMVFSPKGFGGMGYIRPRGFVNGNWKRFSQFYTGSGARKGAPIEIENSFSGPPTTNQTEHLRAYEFHWRVADMQREPTLDVIAVPQLSADGRWPLEIAFYAKKDGQQALGVVPALTRPR